MFETLVSPNEDLGKLVEKGYAVGFDEGYLIVRDIPYLDNELQLQIGALVCKYTKSEGDLLQQEDHQMFFAGSLPYGLDGSQIPNLGSRDAVLPLDPINEDVVVQRQFSVKPYGQTSFQDFFVKVETYVDIISGPATSKYKKTAITFNAKHEVPDSVFLRQDLLTSRAEIGDLSARLKNDVIAIIGLGGTGSYVLDFMAKTPVREIRCFDPDVFHWHTIFRSPGMIDPNDLGHSKAEIYEKRYEDLRVGVHANQEKIEAAGSADLDDVTFAFICVDKGSSRSDIIKALLERKIPFIDVGIGLGRNSQGGPLGGLIKTTYFSTDEAETLLEKRLVTLGDHPDQEYRSNVQIGELNALNACLAVIRYKQVRGFYESNQEVQQLVFEIRDLQMTPWRLE